MPDLGRRCRKPLAVEQGASALGSALSPYLGPDAVETGFNFVIRRIYHNHYAISVQRPDKPLQRSAFPASPKSRPPPHTAHDGTPPCAHRPRGDATRPCPERENRQTVPNGSSICSCCLRRARNARTVSDCSEGLPAAKRDWRSPGRANRTAPGRLSADRHSPPWS